MKVPLLDLKAQYKKIIDKVKLEIDEVIESNQYILGPKVSQFESKICEKLNISEAVGCASGTDALVLALKALEIGPGDEVITTPFTFFATAGAIARVGAKPIFVDIKSDTFNIDPELIEDKISQDTKAIIPVHLFGQPCEMDVISGLAKKYRLHIIEDNAQGINSEYDGFKAGHFGDIATLSFFPSKNLGGMGDGGMCLTNNKELADKIRQLRVHGENPKYHHKWIGLNSRLDSLQAAVLNVKIEYLEKWSDMRIKNAKYYDELFFEVEEITTPYIHPKAVSIYNQYTILVERRDELQAYLKENEIGCAVYYPRPLHLQECFSYLKCKEMDCPNAVFVADNVLSIPIYSEISKKKQEYVVETIKKFYSNPMKGE